MFFFNILDSDGFPGSGHQSNESNGSRNNKYKGPEQIPIQNVESIGNIIRR